MKVAMQFYFIAHQLALRASMAVKDLFAYLPPDSAMLACLHPAVVTFI